MVALLAVAAIVAATFAQRSYAQENRVDREAAFAAKADKVLKRVRMAAAEDRLLAASGRLKRETSEIDRLSRTVGVDRNLQNRVTVDVAVRLTTSSDEDLKAAGFRIAARVGDMATLQTDVDRLPELAALESVGKIFAAINRYPLNDRARQTVGIEDVSGQRTVSQTGRGVVVAIIDSGIDFRHLDFTVPGSDGRQTRIKALLDMTVYDSQAPDSGWNYALPGQSAAIGHLYTEADINAALQSGKPADQNADIVKQRDKNGHGTHVAGTAAGSGLSSPTIGTYAGMAPEADLIVVKASRQNNGDASFRTTDIINALQFVQQKATELNEPFVINMSLGAHLGPHDGTNPDERAIDNLVNSGHGRAVVVAAGNDGNSGIHASATVPAGGNLTLDLNVSGQAQFVDLYQAKADRLNVTVTRPDGVIIGPVSYDPNGMALQHGQASDEYLQIFNANDNKGDSDPANDQPDIFLTFKAGAPKGLWRITVQDADSNPNLPFNAWAGGEGVTFASHVDNVDHLVASPGTARGALTVGAYVTRSSNLVWGSPAPFTSPGPTADGRLKPDISAPGYYLYSSRSTDVTATNFGTIGTNGNAPTDNTHYTGLAGTSMAAPVTAGAVALMMESNPSLTSEQIGDSIRNTARPAYSSNWDPSYGFGKLDIKSAINLGGRQTYTISGHVATDSGSATLTLSGSQSGSTNVDNLGNYKFKNLIAGGTYTVTPSIGAPYQYVFSPASQTFSNLSGDQVADFTVSKKTYNVSGYIRDSSGKGLAGVRVMPDLGSATFVTSDANGFYVLNLPAGQYYYVSASHPDYILQPGPYRIDALSKDETANFTATRLYDISGRVTDQAGNGMSGLTVQLAGGLYSDSVTTDSNGNYRIRQRPEGQNYIIKAWGSFKTVVSPNSAVVMNLSSAETVNFVARSVTQTHSIGGRVFDASGSPLRGIRVDVGGSVTGATLTNENGNYSFSSFEQGGNYTITPSSQNHNFTPNWRSFSSLNQDQAADFTEQTATQEGWLVSTLASNQIETKTWTSQGRTYAYVKLFFPDTGYRIADWGYPVGAGSDVSVNALLERFTGPSGQAVKTTAQIYDLGPLAPGNYTFTFKNSGTVVKAQPFTVVSTPPPANPIDEAREFVRWQYKDFLGREPDGPGWDHWTAEITQCSNDPSKRLAGESEAQCIVRKRANTSAAFFFSPEFQNTGSFVLRVYRGSLGRMPYFGGSIPADNTRDEFTRDHAKVSAGIVVNNQLEPAKINANKQAFVNEFVTRPEFLAIYGSLNNEQYVDKLFQTTGIAPESFERQQLIDGLAAGTETKASVLFKIVDGTMVHGGLTFQTRYGGLFYQQQFKPNFVQMEYFGYLKRDPDEAGYAFWLGKLNTFGSWLDAQMVMAFVQSPEYRARFGQP